MVEFLHASVALLASMVLVLAGMVGWLYYQQTRLFQNMNSIIMVVGELARPPPAPVNFVNTQLEEETVTDVEPKHEVAEDVHAEPVEIDDDRVSVEPESSVVAEVVSGAPEPIDTDGLQDKSAKELKDMLTKRGIPFGKRDNKNTLITLLKATA
jgi:hypothetical protein